MTEFIVKLLISIDVLIFCRSIIVWFDCRLVTVILLNITALTFELCRMYPLKLLMLTFAMLILCIFDACIKDVVTL